MQSRSSDAGTVARLTPAALDSAFRNQDRASYEKAMFLIICHLITPSIGSIVQKLWVILVEFQLWKLALL